MIDLHSHVLPGLDDGVRTVEESIDLISAAVRDGVTMIAATPHVRDDYPTTPDEMEVALASMRTAAADAGIEVDLRGGGEIALDRLRQLSEDDISRFGLGGNPRLLLLEFPYFGWSLELGLACGRLTRAGIVPVIAHPERNGEVQAQPHRLEELVTLGAVVQLTTASVTGRLGSRPQQTARRLLELGLAHLVATDAHGFGRDSRLSSAARAVGDDDLAAWLCADAPAALVAGEPLPARPPVPAKRRRRRFRLTVRRDAGQ